jgi:hypothetical protein
MMTTHIIVNLFIIFSFSFSLLQINKQPAHLYTAASSATTQQSFPVTGGPSILINASFAIRRNFAVDRHTDNYIQFQGGTVFVLQLPNE